MWDTHDWGISHPGGCCGHLPGLCSLSRSLWMETSGSIKPRVSKVLQMEKELRFLCPDSDSGVLVQWQTLPLPLRSFQRVE